MGPWGELLEYSDDGVIRSHMGGPVGVRPVPRPPTFRRRDRYSRVFLNYRRDDSEAYAGRLQESLTREFGRDEVFMDLFSIAPGDAWEWTVQQAAAHCEVMVSVIGAKWLTVTDANQKRRLDSEYDLVRREIVTAIDRGVVLIPVIVARGSVPERSTLPAEMHGLERHQAPELTPRHWEDDVTALIVSIREGLR